MHTPYRGHCTGHPPRGGYGEKRLALYIDWGGEKVTNPLRRENSRPSEAERKPCVCPEPRSACVRKRDTGRGGRCRRQTSLIVWFLRGFSLEPGVCYPAGKTPGDCPLHLEAEAFSLFRYVHGHVKKVEIKCDVAREMTCINSKVWDRCACFCLMEKARAEGFRGWTVGGGRCTDE